MKEGFEMERSIREFIGITIIIVILFFAGIIPLSDLKVIFLNSGI